MPIKAIIIEDELSAQRHLTRLIDKVDFDIQILASLSTVAKVIEWLRKFPEPDLIFMDIHLSDDTSFSIFEHIDIRCPIIFTTAYHEYALRAFKTSGIDYLLKPITKDDLERALDKYSNSKMNHQDMLFNFLDTLSHHTDTEYKERFLLKDGYHFTPVKTHDIAYFYRNELVFARCFDGHSYSLDKSLSQLQKELNPRLFIRLNRQLLININSIEKLTTYKPGRFSLQITPGYHEEITLSHERSSWLRKFLNR